MEGADQTFGYESNFYEELDETTRGATFGEVDGFDFYVEPDNTTRGASLGDACLPTTTLYHSGGTYDFDAALNPFGDPFDEHCGKLDFPGHSQSEIPDFQQTAQPPEVPFGGSAGPTVVLERAYPADVMKAMYDHLQYDAGVSVTKVRLQKCSMTASAFVQEGDLLLQCLIKIRLFKLGVWDDHDNQRRTVVEFLRRDGDSIAFARIFNRIVSELRTFFIVSDSSEDVGSTAAPLPTLLLPITDFDSAANDLQPYVDTLEKAASPAEQADALAAMAVLAQKSPQMTTAVAAAVAHLQGVVQLLESSPVFSVAYPALLLSSRLHDCSSPLGIC